MHKHSLKLTILLLSFLSSWICFAQDTTTTNDVPQDTTITQNAIGTLPNLTIKWMPASLSEPIPYLQFGLEHKLFKKLYINYDFGVAPTKGLWFRYFEDFIGFRGRVALLHYWTKPPNEKAPFFIGVEGAWKYEQWSESDWVTMEDELFFQKMDIDYNKNVFNLSVLFGSKLFLEEDKLTLDFLGGVGVKIRNVTMSGIPEGATLGGLQGELSLQQILSPLYSDSGRYPNAFFSVKLGYIIK